MNTQPQVQSLGASVRTIPPSAEELKKRFLPLCPKHGIKRIDLFGSVARGESKPGSDVDVIIELSPDKRPSLFDILDIQEDLSNAAGVPVQVMTENDYQNIGNPYLLISIRENRFTLLRL